MDRIHTSPLRAAFATADACSHSSGDARRVMRRSRQKCRGRAGA
ncbi:MAG TPA: hypothetical protein VFE05_16225 [Longimicrobiaceae bacterium]|nr:hypothetical protein [Longimicrobiaceae bacterium]